VVGVDWVLKVWRRDGSKIFTTVSGGIDGLVWPKIKRPKLAVRWTLSLSTLCFLML
jgi:hypothetical protein